MSLSDLITPHHLFYVLVLNFAVTEAVVFKFSTG